MFRFVSLIVPAIVVSVAFAGDLAPPVGAIESTMKSLDEIEPRIALTQENTPGNAMARFVINRGGSYYLTESLTTGFEESGIRVTAHRVTIDLNGYTLEWDPDGDGAIGIDATGRSNVTIQNGFLEGYTSGIIAGTDARIENVTVVFIENNGITVGDGSRLTGVTVRSSGFAGVSMGNDVTLRECVFENNGSVGVSANDGATLIDCRLKMNTGDGISVGNGATLTGCVCKSNGGAGISAGDGATFTGCRMESNGGSGIDSGAESKVANCIAYQNMLSGISISGGTISNCTAAANTGVGFSVNRESTITDSLAKRKDRKSVV